MCLAGRIWTHSDGDYDSDDLRIIEDDDGNRTINFLD